MKEMKVGNRILVQKPLFDNDGNIRGKYFTFKDPPKEHEEEE
jgi:hypothetical protein